MRVHARSRACVRACASLPTFLLRLAKDAEIAAATEELPSTMTSAALFSKAEAFPLFCNGAALASMLFTLFMH